jgi:hypothetical protein
MKRTILSLALCLAGLLLLSQPSITSSFNPSPGDNYRYHPVNTSVTPGSSGANIVWDFSGIQIIYNPITGKYLSPSATPYVNDFPGCNVAYEDYFMAGTYHYYQTSSTKWEKKGEASVMLTAVFDNPMTMFTYPFTYNTVITDSFSCHTSVGSLVLDKRGIWQITGDAYGILKLPSGNYHNVLRVKKIFNTVDDYSGTTINEKDIEEYCWISTTSKVPLFRITTEYNFANGSPTDTLSSIRISDEVAGISDPGGMINGIKLFPNPGSGDVELIFYLPQPESLDISLIAADGKEMWRQDPELCMPGKNSKIIHTENLPSGMYFLNLKMNGYCTTLKFVRY